MKRTMKHSAAGFLLLVTSARATATASPTSAPTAPPTAAPTYTTETCANLVPYEELQRGKSAYFSGCQPEADITGCFRPGQYTYENPGVFGPEDDHYGCQTCIVQESWAQESVFQVYWGGNQRDAMAPCPTTFNYTAFIEDKYSIPIADLTVVTGAEITNAAECGQYPAGTFYNQNETRCYFKSTRYGLANGFAEAARTCTDMGGGLVAVDSQAENDWILHNLLWIGYQGESYIGLYKYNDINVYRYVNSSGVEFPKAFNGNSVAKWYNNQGPWYPEMDVNSVYADSETPARSCVEMYPNVPKSWNPFSCEVLQQYICELPATSYVPPTNWVPPSTDIFRWAFTAAPTPAPTPVGGWPSTTAPAASQTSAPAAGSPSGSTPDAPSDGGANEQGAGNGAGSRFSWSPRTLAGITIAVSGLLVQLM